jgi:hypothetical protein
VSPIKGEKPQRFEPTVEGCDAAVVAFAGRHAVATFLSRILNRAG